MALEHCEHYGLSPGPVKVHEPCQTLGLVEYDPRAAIGLDVGGAFPDWKEWNFRGLDIRDVTEWYISTRIRRGYIRRIFERQCVLRARDAALGAGHEGVHADCPAVAGGDGRHAGQT
jgi:hypothetical protein